MTSKKKDATKEENEKFLGMLKDLQKAKPPEGEQKSWDKFTKALWILQKKIVKGEDVEKIKATLAKAGGCAKCHKVTPA